MNSILVSEIIHNSLNNGLNEFQFVISIYNVFANLNVKLKLYVSMLDATDICKYPHRLFLCIAFISR